MTSKIKEELRCDHRIIGEMVSRGSKVLDMGCGAGELLEYLVSSKEADGTGVEISEQAIYQCVEKGLSVSQGDIDTDSKSIPTDFLTMLYSTRRCSRYIALKTQYKKL